MPTLVSEENCVYVISYMKCALLGSLSKCLRDFSPNNFCDDKLVYQLAASSLLEHTDRKGEPQL